MTRGTSRRDFARALLGAGIALPFLRMLGLDPFTARPALAAPASTKRVVFAYIPDGVANWGKDIGSVRGGPTDFNLGNMVAPFAPFKNDVVVIDGLDMSTDQVADTHTQGMVLYLTGDGFQATCASTKDCVGSGGSLGVKGPSLDQYLAKKVGGATPFASLQLAAQPNNGFTISFSGAGTGKAIPPNPDPVDAYSTLFANVGTPDPKAVTRLALRKSVLDNVGSDLQALRGRLGAEDRAKLDQQLSAVRAMESRLDGGGAKCAKPKTPSVGGLQDAANYGRIADAHVQVLFNALACDLTRIATLQFRACYSELDLPFDPLNVNDDNIHNQSHEAFDDGGPGYKAFVKTKAWHYQQVANLAQLLAQTQEADGSGRMLDNTLIVTSSDIGEGHTHARMPWVTVGGKNLGVKTGQLLTVPKGTPHTRLLVSILNMLGVPDTTFGNPKYGSGPLAGFGA